MQIHEGRSWRVYHNGSFEFSGLVVKFTSGIDRSDDSTGCEQADEDDHDATEADTVIYRDILYESKVAKIRNRYNKVSCRLLGSGLVLNIYIKQRHFNCLLKACFDVKLSFLFVTTYYSMIHINKCICNKKFMGLQTCGHLL